MAKVVGFCVYEHWRPDVAAFYVGKGKGNRPWNLFYRRNRYHTNCVKRS